MLTDELCTNTRCFKEQKPEAIQNQLVEKVLWDTNAASTCYKWQSFRKKTQIYTTPASSQIQRCTVLSMVQLCFLVMYVYLHTAALALVSVLRL